MQASGESGHVIRRVLLVSMYNSGSSQMAAAYINQASGGRFAAESAGRRPRDIDALVLEAMREDGIDLSKTPSPSLSACREKQRFYDYIISVITRGETFKCPAFPGSPSHLIWPFPDRRDFSGSRSVQLEKTCRLRDQIKAQVRKWLDAMEKGQCPAEKVIPFQRISAEQNQNRLSTV